MRGVKLVFKEHINNWDNTWNMALKDLKKQYSGTVLGYTWAIIKNLIFVMAYWFAIAMGLRKGKEVGFPYIAWLVSGLGAWFFIKEVIVPAATSIRKNKYLVTKMVFPVSTISTIKVLSSFLSSLLFLPIIMIILLGSGIKINFHWVQIIYYQCSLMILLVGISWLTSALVVMSRDIEMLINSTVLVLFWGSPILYPAENIGGIIGDILKLNPFYYIVEGFRASFLYGQWFWERPTLTVYFWIITILFLFLGAFVHSRLRNQFVDVL